MNSRALTSESPLAMEPPINHFDDPGPRYSGYPRAAEFHGRIAETEFRNWARLSNEELIPKPLSLNFHIPFCSSICYHCANNKIIPGERQKTEHYLRNLQFEIEIQSQLYDRDREVVQLRWAGGAPGYLTHRQAQDLMVKIRQNFNLSRAGPAEFSIEIDPRVIAKDAMAELRSLGFNRISIGVYDLDAQVQQAVGRVQNPEATAAVIKDANNYGIRSTNIDLIYGLPRQTVQSFAVTLDRIVGLDPDQITIYNYAQLPHRFPRQRRFQAGDLPDAAEKLAILHYATERLCSAGYAHIGMDHFAKPDHELAQAQRDGRLHRNFQSYSTQGQCDSIGFGVAAISQVHDNFSQNTNSLEVYHDSLDLRKLPIVKGYVSLEDDLLRREIIHDLSSQFHLDKRKYDNKWNIDFDQLFTSELSRLADMVEQGLLELGEDEINLREPGRLLVRNICMVFDSFQQPASVARLFAKRFKSAQAHLT
ncbi:MAG: Coproporphyrinogen III oxidase, oxygen-independent (EC 1.3.99.22) [Olavius algarvensis Gamma 3 endosymbiont]|nr:MAG: Coproporphyrinogen III oxidase, oxygen-independent (EC 1.3.99.22) [Olavius algarvensis Gamma 3 endosymbiont]